MKDRFDPSEVMVFMLAYNAEHTLEKTWRALPPGLRHCVVVGDDFSGDATSSVAENLGLRVVRHQRNLNYGGNLKALFQIFLEEQAAVAIELHADYQYDPRLADLMVEYVWRGYFDLVQGNRIRTRREALAGGMPLYRYLGNRCLTLAQNLWFGTVFGEWHSGLRAYSRRLIAECPLDDFSDTHAFASDILMYAVASGFRVGEAPCPVRYESESSSVPLPKLFDYAWQTMVSSLRYPPWKRLPLRPSALESHPDLISGGTTEQGLSAGPCGGGNQPH